MYVRPSFIKASSQRTNERPIHRIKMRLLTYFDTDSTQDDKECLRIWRLTDPAEDRVRIQDAKDTLLEQSCAWVFNDPAFTKWFNDDESVILWIHGDPGKGKTMMMMAAIDELSRRLKSTQCMMSYFIFQSSMPKLNNASVMV